MHDQISLDIGNPDTFAHGHPYAIYDRIRETQPVWRHPASDLVPAMWALTRFDDIRAVSLDSESFTSAQGFIVPTSSRRDIDPEIGIALSRFMLAMDNPEHKDFRNVVASAFRPSALAAVQPRIQTSVDRLIADLAGKDEVDFVTEVAAIVPIKTVCAVMGIPEEDEWRVFEFTNTVFGIDDPELAPTPEVTNARYRELFDYGWNLFEARRREPRDDVLSKIANATVGGRPLTPIEQKSFFSNMISAGNETTRSTLAGSIWALAKNPDQRRLLLDDMSLLPSAVNELIRWFSPVYHFSRVAKQDTVVGGQPIKAGEHVAMLYGAGNHDPAMFPNPHQLDLRRENAKANIAFGYGVHHCLGSRLGIMQLNLILAAFLKAFPHYEVTGEPSYVRSNLVQAMKVLPVRLQG